MPWQLVASDDFSGSSGSLHGRVMPVGGFTWTVHNGTWTLNGSGGLGGSPNSTEIFASFDPGNIGPYRITVRYQTIGDGGPIWRFSNVSARFQTAGGGNTQMDAPSPGWNGGSDVSMSASSSATVERVFVGGTRHSYFKDGGLQADGYSTGNTSDSAATRIGLKRWDGTVFDSIEVHKWVDEPDPLWQYVAFPDYISTSFVMAGVGGGNAYAYIDLTSTTDYTIQSGDILCYDLWRSQSLNGIGFDYTASDGTFLRGTAHDQFGHDAHPSTAVPDSLVLNRWYPRSIVIPGGHAGKTITQYTLVTESDAAGTWSGRFRNMRIVGPDDVVRKVIWRGGSFTSAATATVSGYTSHTFTGVSVKSQAVMG